MPAAAETPCHPALTGLTVLERGWLSSNNILIHAAPGEPGAVLVDTGHVVHREQTLALVRHALQCAAGNALEAAPAAQRLARIVNTHLHSDHCGGNALLQQAFAAPIVIPPGLADAVRAWDLARLLHDDFGQRERFFIEGTLAPSESFVAGGRRWHALAAPGHDPHSLVFFDADAGLLLSADALWENGFGVVFPELVGESGFDEVGATLDRIEGLPVRLVVPGHGAPFTDVAGALARARSRLAGYRADPARHARHAAKVLVKYHVMEERRLPLADLVRWSAVAPLMVQVWDRFGAGRDAATTLTAWIEGFVHELVGSGALAIEAGDVVDR
jgi:glyoxylase-like metal-dependent hydrolase (beta-lactamase superfamily II)